MVIVFPLHPSLSRLPCQFALAVCYDNGIGVAKDVAKAAEWFSRAADQGLADAQVLRSMLWLSP